MSSEALRRLCRNDRVMIRRMCHVRTSDEPDMMELLKKLGLEDLTPVIHKCRLRWFGHVEKSTAEISKVRSKMHIAGKIKKGRKTWSECVREDLGVFNLTCDAQDRDGWRSSAQNSRLEPTLQCGSTSLSAAVPPACEMCTRSSINNKPRFD